MAIESDDSVSNGDVRVRVVRPQIRLISANTYPGKVCWGAWTLRRLVPRRSAACWNCYTERRIPSERQRYTREAGNCCDELRKWCHALATRHRRCCAAPSASTRAGWWSAATTWCFYRRPICRRCGRAVPCSGRADIRRRGGATRTLFAIFIASTRFR